ncbi:hypothetical protein E4U43_006449 [Claviceps pusilla]|uniref:Methyltransferase n=1 Tax=Claviceps pusilla TaxID=123648 RepID=A0A9P7NDQ4_9HYPO|nr:hypothetical protein E4U43_006449 [Claviceps pusilla]
MSHEQPQAEPGSVTSPAASTPDPAPVPATPAPPRAAPEDFSASESLVESDSQLIQARDEQDEDSALGTDDDASATTSLRSSITRYREENGRTYHSYAESSESSSAVDGTLYGIQLCLAQRSDLQHHLFSLTLGGKLYEAPLDQHKIGRLLDAGTGTGIWAIDIGDKFPNAEILGVDISPIQPTFVPPNVSFVMDDLELEWTYRRPFDFVFGRMLVGSIGDWPKFMRQSFDNLNSGGWIELQDIVLIPKCDDGTMSDDSAIKIWGDRIMECCDILKRYGDSALRYKQQMIDAGFINVTEVKYKWPTNPWPAEQHYRDLGFWTYHDIADGLSGLSMAGFTRCLGWTMEQVELFLVSVKKEMKDKHIHAYWSM